MTESNPGPSDPVPPPTPAGSPPPIDYGGPRKGPIYSGPAPTQDEITMGMLCHLLAIFTWFLAPLIIWLMKKDQSPFVDDQGKETLNFQLTTMIAFALCFPLICVGGLGAILMICVHIVRIIFTIIGTVNAYKGVAYRYPVTLRLIK